MNGTVAPPVRCERLAEMAVRFGGIAKITAPERRECYAVRVHASLEVQEFLRRSAASVVGPELVARLPGGRVYRTGIVLSPDGASIARDVSLDFGKTETEHWLLGQKRLRAPERVEGRTVVIASTLASGYSHWLLDELPRLLALEEGERHGRLIAHATHPFAQRALALSGWRGVVVEPRDSLHLQSEELMVPSLVGSVEKPTPRAGELLAAFVRPLEAAPGWGERIYLSRERARRRRVTNEAALRSQLEARGFVTLHLETLSWAEQINAFREAKVIVAPHGAGLANLVFCPPGTRVVELFNRDYVNGCYARVAAVRQLDYRAIVPSGETPLLDSPAGSRLDLTVAVDAVIAAVNG